MVLISTQSFAAEDSDKEDIISGGGDIELAIPDASEETTRHSYRAEVNVFETPILNLPENLYSACLILPFATFPNNTACQDRWLDIQIMCLLFFNCALQYILVVYVWVIYDEKLKNELSKCGGYVTRKALRWICVIVYTGFCSADILDSLNMMSWLVSLVGNPFSGRCWDCLMCIPNLLTCNLLKKGGTAVKRMVNVEVADRTLATNRISSEIADGIKNSSCLWRVYSFSCILFKLGVGLALVCYGAAFVVMTDKDEDLILNALALTFILQVDKMIYNFAFNQEMKYIVLNLSPHLKLHVHGGTEKVYRNFGILAKVLLLTFLSLGTITTFCDNLWTDGQFQFQG